MSPEDPGLLGNLPRSRPGRRSQKRDSPTRASRPRKPPARPEPADDPVGGALRVAAKGVGSGLRVANGVTREVLRRLPRP